VNRWLAGENDFQPAHVASGGFEACIEARVSRGGKSEPLLEQPKQLAVHQPGYSLRLPLFLREEEQPLPSNPWAALLDSGKAS